MTTGRINQVTTVGRSDWTGQRSRLGNGESAPASVDPNATTGTDHQNRPTIDRSRSVTGTRASSSNPTNNWLPSRPVRPTSQRAFFRAPLGTSLRGRDLRDGRVRNERFLVRILDRSGPNESILTPWSQKLAPSAGDCACRSGVPSLLGRVSLGLATSLPSTSYREGPEVFLRNTSAVHT